MLCSGAQTHFLFFVFMMAQLDENEEFAIQMQDNQGHHHRQVAKVTLMLKPKTKKCKTVEKKSPSTL